MWHEWDPDTEDGFDGDPSLWCRGHTTDRTALAMALFRLGFVDSMGAAYRTSETAELRHDYACLEPDADGDERTLHRCQDGEGDPQPVTFAVLAEPE